ncbi:CPBP family intramembrane glutamic endopeptidase [Clostridium paridis]|uniref:CPBP family intramembrane metalloprotease n=1 Tax=Clostridium paridis TaxID=2803863 RepID=A0A937K362_9CLOT|nr:type II CAAX endopeptidase family protein [Clostridium paridis]MBL4930419.1 CPBP family intramembrane metalloprotease [Clostridium paridis]
MKKVFRANLYFLIILVLSVFGPEVINPFLVSIGVRDVRIVLETNHILLFLVPATIYIFVTKSSFKKTFRLNPISFKNVLLIIGLGFAIQPVMMLFSLITSFFFNNDISNFINSISDTPYPVMLLLIAVTPAITEEVTLRGVVLSGYNFKNKWIAAITTGILFGIFHLNAQQFLYAAVLGMVLAYLVRVTNSIFASSLLHFMINGIQVSLQKILAPFVKNNSTPDIASLGIDAKITALISYGTLAVIFGALSIIIIRKIEKNCKSKGIYDCYESLSMETEMALRTELIKERVINLPMIGIIVFYLFAMIVIIK